MYKFIMSICRRLIFSHRFFQKLAHRNCLCNIWLLVLFFKCFSSVLRLFSMYIMFYRHVAPLHHSIAHISVICVQTVHIERVKSVADVWYRYSRYHVEATLRFSLTANKAKISRLPPQNTKTPGCETIPNSR